MQLALRKTNVKVVSVVYGMKLALYCVVCPRKTDIKVMISGMYEIKLVFCGAVSPTETKHRGPDPEYLHDKIGTYQCCWFKGDSVLAIVLDMHSTLLKYTSFIYQSVSS